MSNTLPDSSLSLASIQRILAVAHHPNADLLDVVTVKGYQAIVKRDQWKIGDLCIFIEPDSVLPESATWTAMYRAKSNRVKAIKLRNVFSFGIVESFENVGYTGPVEDGLDVTAVLGVTKYDPPAPQDLSASGPYGYGIPKTDEHRWQSISDLPYGKKVDVTLKIDGQSWSAFVKFNSDGTVEKGIGGRTFLFKEDTDNNYTRNEKRYNALEKLEAFCRNHGNVSLCIRGESYGEGIQSKNHNPHSKAPKNLALFSVWLIDERRYATKGNPFYIHAIAGELGIPTVPVIEKDVVLTPEMVHYYSEGINKINSQPFEGVVINHESGSFKVINLEYDSKK